MDLMYKDKYEAARLEMKKAEVSLNRVSYFYASTRVFGLLLRYRYQEGWQSVINKWVYFLHIGIIETARCKHQAGAYQTEETE